MNDRFLPDDFLTSGKNKGPAHGRVVDPADLARCADFHLGATTVRPSTRTLDGPGGTVTIEPRVMQVLVTLADARGAVVTRDDLIQSCWNGLVVGDDAVNRVIAEIRRAARDAGAGSFTVETIPKTGFRILVDSDPAFAAEAASPAPTISRRRLIGGAAVAGVAALGGLAAWTQFAGRPDPRAAELAARGAQILRDEMPASDQQGIGLLTESTRIDPGNADTWGLLALAWRNAAEHGTPDEVATAVRSCEATARRALALDPNQANALTALAKLRPIFGDWSGAEQRLRDILKIAPDNKATVSSLGTLLQAVGRVRESAVYSSRSAELDPLSPIYQFRKTFGLWCTGRLAEADRTIDRALQLWPRHPAVWNTRTLLFALTDRPRAARAMIDDREGRPLGMPQPAVDYWRAPLKALETGAPADIAAAREAGLAVLQRSPGTAAGGICFASKLGDLDTAFALADAYLLRRGPLVGGVMGSGPDQLAVTDGRWRITMMLFIPATAPMRADARFLPLCREMGMTDYWRASGTRPDYLT